MEDWQRQHIENNLATLISVTKFNTSVTTALVGKNVLDEAEVDGLDALQNQKGCTAASSEYYKLLVGRTDAYTVLIKTLMQYSQSGAAKILIRVPYELYGGPLANLNIQTEKYDFLNTNIKVHGKTYKLVEFFSAVSSNPLQEIFGNTIHQTEFYDTFIRKERTFVLANNTIPPEPLVYIPRFLSNKIILPKSIFKVECPDRFVFKNNIKRHKVSQIVKPHFTESSSSQLITITCRFIYLEDNEHWIDLKMLSKDPIHLVNYEHDQDIFVLEDPSELSDLLRKFGSKEKNMYYSEDKIVLELLNKDSNTSNVCICDTPGMGKTLLMQNIARRMMGKCNGRIIAYIQLKIFSSQFIRLSPENPEMVLLSVLKYITPSHANTELLLLKLLNAQLIHLEIFFDGFDDIPPAKVDWIKQVFLPITTQFPKVRLYVTSRSHLRHKLEKNLGGIAYDLLPFDEPTQLIFLVKFWSKKGLKFDHVLLQKYATSCLKSVKSSLKNADNEITEIPLLCDLIAELYNNKAAIHLFKQGKSLQLPAKLSGLYQKLIEERINSTAENETEFSSYKLAHCWLSLKLLFPTYNFHEDKIFRGSRHIKRSPKILEAGIIKPNSVTEWDFIHPTFAEYFAAEYFYLKLENATYLTTEPENVNQEIISILNLLLITQSDPTFHPRDSIFRYSVILTHLDFHISEFKTSEKFISLVAMFLTYISPENLFSIVCACCQQNVYNIFYLLKYTLTKCSSQIIQQYFKAENWLKDFELFLASLQECFTMENYFELFSVCIKNATSKMFRCCVCLCTETFKTDIIQIFTYKDYKLLEVACFWDSYEVVEYFVNTVPLKSETVSKCILNLIEDNSKRESILRLLVSSLNNEFPDTFVRSFDNLRLIKLLIELGVDLNVEGNDKENCATYAANHLSPEDYHEFVRLILTQCGAEYLFAQNEKWVDPLARIIERIALLPETLNLLLNIRETEVKLRTNGGKNLLFAAVRGNKLKNLQQLVNYGFDYNTRGIRNQSLLHVACQYGNVQLVQYLLSLSLNIDSKDDDNETPLHIAVANQKRLAVIEKLTDNGANIQARNWKGQSALHISALCAHEEIIKYLIVKGLRVNDPDKDGNTPLHLCEPDSENQECLVDMGGNINAINNYGQTPTQIYETFRLC